MVQPRPAVANPALTRPDWCRGESARNPGLLWLDKNENADPELHAITHRVLSELDPTHLWTYPEMGAFYRKLAAVEDTPPETLLLAAGSDGVIRTVFEAFVSPGDVVLHTTPTFAMYPVYCMIFGARPVTLEYAPSEHGPSLPVETVLQSLEQHRPRLLCLPNPDSPTGTVFAPAELEAILRKAEEVGAVALIDEAYYPFYSSTAAHWIGEYRNLVVARTFSKAWGLAGLRTGFSIACPELTRVLHKVRPMYEVNTVAIGYLDRMLDMREAVHASVARLEAGKAFFNRSMRELGFPVLNGHGNFAHVAFGDRQAAIFPALDQVVLFRKDFKDACLRGYSRFTSAPEGVFTRVVEAIRRAR